MSVTSYHEMTCPKCKEDFGLHVEFTGTALLLPNGSDDCGDHEWNDESSCWCSLCSWQGTVAQAKEAAEGSEKE